MVLGYLIFGGLCVWIMFILVSGVIFFGIEKIYCSCLNIGGVGVLGIMLMLIRVMGFVCRLFLF